MRMTPMTQTTTHQSVDGMNHHHLHVYLTARARKLTRKMTAQWKWLVAEIIQHYTWFKLTYATKRDKREKKKARKSNSGTAEDDAASEKQGKKVSIQTNLFMHGLLTAWEIGASKEASTSRRHRIGWWIRWPIRQEAHRRAGKVKGRTTRPWEQKPGWLSSSTASARKQQETLAIQV